MRSAIGGILMGLANLVPGVSGGTMILVMGLYDEFIGSIADVTRFRFTKRNISFLLIVGCAAIAAIATLAGTLSRAVTLHRSAMFALFIGLTLGGVPRLIKMLKGFTASAGAALILGLAIMVTIAATKADPPDRDAVKQAVAGGEFRVEPDYATDVAAGVLGMSAMVLPGVSGAYMVLILGRYETILASIAVAKEYAISYGGIGNPMVFLRVLIPVGVGSVLALVLLSNFLKWMLNRHEKATLGLLLGILLGSVVGIWPFDGGTQFGDYVLGVLLALAGFGSTLLLSRINT